MHLSYLLLLPSLTLAAPQDKSPNPPYQCCRYPGWPTTVLNFEYPELNPDHTIYHGLKWKGWSDYYHYPGYLTGWAPIPSNYTTVVAKTGPKEWELHLEEGSEAFEDVFSLWFNYHEFGPLAGAMNTEIIFSGWYQGGWVGQVNVATDTAEDNAWRHVCFNWTRREDGGLALVDRLTVLLPDCRKRKCDGKWFEVDDVWVKPRRSKG